MAPFVRRAGDPGGRTGSPVALIPAGKGPVSPACSGSAQLPAVHAGWKFPGSLPGGQFDPGCG